MLASLTSHRPWRSTALGLGTSAAHLAGGQALLTASLQPMPPRSSGRLRRCRSPRPGTEMWEPGAAASPLPRTRSLLIKPLSICRRLHGSSPSALAERWRYRRAD